MGENQYRLFCDDHYVYSNTKVSVKLDLATFIMKRDLEKVVYDKLP